MSHAGENSGESLTTDLFNHSTLDAIVPNSDHFDLKVLLTGDHVPDDDEAAQTATAGVLQRQSLYLGTSGPSSALQHYSHRIQCLTQTRTQMSESRHA